MYDLNTVERDEKHQIIIIITIMIDDFRLFRQYVSHIEAMEGG